MEKDLEKQVESLSEKIKHYLVSTTGHLVNQASDIEIFRALSYALREEIMINWAATARSIENSQQRRLYYISMEYLPGRLLVNNISSLHAHDLVKKAIHKLGRDYKKILFLEPDPGLGNGGLGRLASCLLDALATQKYPATGYGLRYQYGIFEQKMIDGFQIEKPDCWLLNENPWELRRDSSSQIVRFGGIAKNRINTHGEIVLDLQDYEEVRSLPFDFPIIGFSQNKDFNINTLRLWSTKESPHNFHLQRYNAGQIGPAAENTALTDVLYPNDYHETGKRIRLKQEFLLVSSSLQDIIFRHLRLYLTLDNFAEKVRIQINDTHPSLIIAEMVLILTTEFEYPWKKAFEITQEIVGYTNHTILREALEEWKQESLAFLLPRQYWVIEQLNTELCRKIRQEYPGDEEKVRRLSIIEKGKVRMSHLAIYGSHHINGVARLHGEILKKQIFKDFFEIFPKRFKFITNGVTQRHWLWHCNALLAEFLIQKIGKRWLTDFKQIQELEPYVARKEVQHEFLEIKKKNKRRLIAFLKKNCPSFPLIDPDSLFDVQVKRFHEYKRQLMNVLNLILIYQDLKDSLDTHSVKRTAIFSGKAAAGYDIAKQIIHLIYCVARTVNGDTSLEDKLKIIFIENYSVSRAEMIIPAAELSEQISTAGMEASGTGNMKMAINGALTIGTEDGANIEMREKIGLEWWPFQFGLNAEKITHLRHSRSYNPWDVYATNPKIKQALDSIKNGFFAKNQLERESHSSLFNTLMFGHHDQMADPYFVLADLEEYYQTQHKVETLYRDPDRWAENALRNLLGMGSFSTDNAVENYAREIWGIEKCPIKPDILEQVKTEYTQQGRYRTIL